MSVISRYIVSFYVRIIALCAGSFITIYLVIDFLEKTRPVHPRSGRVPVYLSFFSLKIPEIIKPDHSLGRPHGHAADSRHAVAGTARSQPCAGAA